MSKPIELREADFRREIDKYTFPEVIKKEFFDYWTEPNKSGTKMRFELEKTWHLGRRLARWVNNSKTILPAAIVHKDSKAPPTRPSTEFDRLDQFMEETQKPGSGIVFMDYGKWYDFMKAEKLLRPMTQKEIDTLLSIYGGDKLKCRCAVVYETLKGYVNHNLRVNDIIQARKRLVNG